MDEIIHPTLKGMEQEGCPFQGVLFAGLMIGKDGPRLIEYNVRFGDPECQSLMLRLKSDLLTALIASADGALKDFDLRWRDEVAITVVMAAKGYPGEYQKNTEIRGLDEAAKQHGVTIFHAGTRRVNGRLMANGGRVLNISAYGPDIVQARERAYGAIDKIDWPEGFCRHEIGWRAVERAK
jgi:phosphoribosylamine--glycine ligase